MKEGTQTTHISVADARGNAVAVTTTLNELYGSGVYLTSAGFFLITLDILMGGGLRLFSDSTPEERWNLKNVVAYKNGFVELSYAASNM